MKTIISKKTLLPTIGRLVMIIMLIPLVCFTVAAEAGANEIGELDETEEQPAARRKPSVSEAFDKGHEGIGIGFVVGSPTGLSLKWNLAGASFASALAWSFSGDTKITINTDHLRYKYALEHESGLGEQLPLYYGLGIHFRYREDKDSIVGLRLPVGFNYLAKEMPMDYFIELAPSLNVFPETDFKLRLALGVRYIF